jgi:hypothetical protein
MLNIGLSVHIVIFAITCRYISLTIKINKKANTSTFSFLIASMHMSSPLGPVTSDTPRSFE